MSEENDENNENNEIVENEENNKIFKKLKVVQEKFIIPQYYLQNLPK